MPRPVPPHPRLVLHVHGMTRLWAVALSSHPFHGIPTGCSKPSRCPRRALGDPGSSVRLSLGTVGMGLGPWGSGAHLGWEPACQVSSPPPAPDPCQACGPMALSGLSTCLARVRFSVSTHMHSHAHTRALKTFTLLAGRGCPRRAGSCRARHTGAPASAAASVPKSKTSRSPQWGPPREWGAALLQPPVWLRGLSFHSVKGQSGPGDVLRLGPLYSCMLWPGCRRTRPWAGRRPWPGPEGWLVCVLQVLGMLGAGRAVELWLLGVAELCLARRPNAADVGMGGPRVHPSSEQTSPALNLASLGAAPPSAPARPRAQGPPTHGPS